MKKYLDYETLKSKLIEKAEELRKENFDCVIAVVRGGLTNAHILGKELMLPVGVFYPKERFLYVPEGVPKNGKFLVVEDLIAEGRTTKIIHSFFKDYNYKYYPFLIDYEYQDNDYDYYSIREKDWIVFPWEQVEKVQEGDRGFFREGTDAYGKIK
jgi:hypoxanthine phosphoribosyltransferase